MALGEVVIQAQARGRGRGGQLGVVSPSTVMTHVNNIFAKTGITSLAQAVHYAYTHGFADPGAS